jgi:hypothetical protein
MWKPPEWEKIKLKKIGLGWWGIWEDAERVKSSFWAHPDGI